MVYFLLFKFYVQLMHTHILCHHTHFWSD